MFERLLFLGPHNVKITNYPIDKPFALFNAGAIKLRDDLLILARATFGYYSYASALVEIKLPLAYFEEPKSDLKGLVKSLLVNTKKTFEGELAIVPSQPYDLFGCEDPRLTLIDNKIHAVYTARLLDYPETGRVVPALAIRDRDGEWIKKGYFKYSVPVISDKNAFLIKYRGRLLLFHRVEISKEIFKMLISEIDRKDLEVIEDRVISFEKLGVDAKRIGWGTPPIKVGSDYLMMIHSAGKEDFVYRGHFLLMNKNLEIEGISKPILQPETIEEKYGDRPMVVFPTGLVELNKDYGLVVYGASDSFVGIARFSIEEAIESTKEITPKEE